MDRTLVSLNEFFVGNQIFDIPVYQRSYAWERKNLIDLWEDIFYMNTSKKHYFGTVLLKDSGKAAEKALTTLKRFDVIDGQQRLTTVSMLLREVLSQLKEVDDQDIRNEVDEQVKHYLKDGQHYKLNLLGDDGEYFHNVIIDGLEFLSSDTATRSQRRLVNARDFFRERLVEQKNRQPDEYLDFLVSLKKKIDDLQLIRYEVTSDADAIRIFETVNDRGRPLSSLEKTKSFLMHTSYLGLAQESEFSGRLEDLNRHFSRMYRHFEDASDTSHLERLRVSEDDVLRYHFINYISPSNQSSRPLENLKHRMRVMLRENPGTECADYALHYTKDLGQAFYAFKEICEAYKGDVEGRTLSKIFMLERMGNIFPLMIAAWHKFGSTPNQMENILELLEAFIVRVYLVGGWRSDSGGSRLDRISHDLHRGYLDYGELVDRLQEINRDYQSDESFRRTFDREDFYTWCGSRNTRYLLTEYEIYLRRHSDVQLGISTREKILTSAYEVEHIWAQHPAEEMSDEEKESHKQNVHRLGNLTIASSEWNKSMGNKPFREKRWQPDGKPSYSNSLLLVQSELSERGEWNVDSIKQREQDIVEFASKRWSV